MAKEFKSSYTPNEVFAMAFDILEELVNEGIDFEIAIKFARRVHSKVFPDEYWEQFAKEWKAKTEGKLKGT
jgi:hypothetical protein